MVCDSLIMATDKEILDGEGLRDMIIEDLQEFSNVFASEFNSSDIHDRVLCFQIIENEELNTKGDTEDTKYSETGSDCLPIYGVNIGERTSNDDENKETEDTVEIVNTAEEVETKETVRKENTSATKKTSVELEQDEKELSEITEMVGEQQELSCKADERQENSIEYQNKEAKGSDEDTETNTSKTADDENRSTVSKLFVHSQWLSVQSPYFKALFYSGMKETYSKEVVMKIQEHELEAHLTLIEAMYKLDVLKDKDYRLVVQVLVLAHMYDVRHVIKKCKYFLMSTTPSLEMCEYILQKIEHLSDMVDIYDMLEKFLVKEFTPIDKTWTMKKFTELSEAALRLLLLSDSLATKSENTIFVALMKWVQLNISWRTRNKCDLLDLVRFEFMSVDFLYDVVKNHLVAIRMLRFNEYLLKGLAYQGFSQIRREQLEPKPKKRPFVEDSSPTFSWVIDMKLEEKLTKFAGFPIFSNRFWYHGYPMQLQLSYDSEDLSKCSLYLKIFDMKNQACLCVSCKAKSVIFSSFKLEKQLYTASTSGWGYNALECNKAQKGKGYTIDVWVEIA